MRRIYKYRLYPNKSQKEILTKTIGICRDVYNSFLEERRNAYKKDKKRISCFDQIKEIPKLKKEKPELSKIHSQVLQDVLRRVDKSYQNFFRRIKEKKSGKLKDKVGFPRYKEKNRYHSFTYPQSGFKLKVNQKKPKHSKLYLSKIGTIKLRYHRPIPKLAKIKTCTIIRKIDKFYVCFSLELPEVPQMKGFTRPIGIDIGLSNLIALNNKEVKDNPRFLRESEEKLKKAQKSLSRKKGFKKGEKKFNNYKKQSRKVAKIHEKITNQRKDYLHKLSRELVNRYDLIVLEDLRVKNMLKNHHLAKSISDASWATFVNQLTYKAEEAGGLVEKVDPKGTSQECPKCKSRVPKSLAVRVHRCPFCGFKEDRDVASADVIFGRSKNLHRVSGVGTTQYACGESGDLDGSISSGVTGSVKQEAPSFR